MNTARLPKMVALGWSDHRPQIHYLTIENQILRSKLPKRVSLTPKARRRLIRFGKAVGDELRHLTSFVQYRTFQKWLRAPKHEKPKKRAWSPRTSAEIRKLVLEMSESPVRDTPVYLANCARSGSCRYQARRSATSSKRMVSIHHRIDQNRPRNSATIGILPRYGRAIF